MRPPNVSPVSLPPPPDEFDRLLEELASEYQRLRQCNADLMRENSILQAKRKVGPGAMLKGNSCQQLLGKNSFSTVQLDVPNLDEEMPEKPKIVKAKSMIPPSPRHAMSPSNSKWSSEKLGEEWSTRPSTITNAATGLEDQFHRLDLDTVGKIGVQDIVRLLESVNETIPYNSLVDLVRAFSSPGSTGADLDFEEMGIDFHAWKEILDETNTCSSFGPKLAPSIKTLRRACLQEQSQNSLIRVESDEAPCTPAQNSISEAFEAAKKKSASVLLLPELVPTLVIVANAVVTGLSVDHTGGSWDTAWDICEGCFFLFYLGEFLVKVRVFGCANFFCGPEWGWNLFDFGCLAISFADVLIMIVFLIRSKAANSPDVGVWLLLKIFRLARLARPLRMMRFKLLHELKLIVIGVVSGLRVLFWAILLLVVLTYLIGVATALLFKEDEREYATVLQAMFTHFRCWTGDCSAYDGTPLAERMRATYGPPYMVFHVLTMIFVTVGVFNLVMAIFIDNVVTAQQTRRHAELGARTHEVELKMKKVITSLIKMKQQQLDEDNNNNKFGLKRSLSDAVKRSLETAADGFQAVPGTLAAINREWARLLDKNILISREVFNKWFSNEEFQAVLEQAEIETSNTGELFDVLDADMGGKLSMDELYTGLMKLRGPVTKADIVAVRLKVRNLTKILENGDVMLDEG